MKKFVLALGVVLATAAINHAQVAYYNVPYRTGPQSGYFYVAPGTRAYYNNGYVTPNYYNQGMGLGGIRMTPYNPYNSVQFNSMMLGIAAAQQQQAQYQQYLLRRLYYGY
jgi:hypothetical protein